jgi:hypothetical protein
VAVNNGGQIFVADTGNHRIQKFSSTGIFVSTLGSQGTGDGQFESPSGVAVDSGGNIYVADTGNHRVQKFTSSGVFVAAIGTFGSGSGQFDSPKGVAIGPSGGIFVTDAVNEKVQVFSPGSGSSNATGNCFIATAAYGSTLDPHVRVLRDFRDRVLASCALGRLFIEHYYAWSPPIARFIAVHDGLRTAVRWALTPVVYTIQYPFLLGLLLVPAVAVAIRKRRHEKNRTAGSV